MKTRTPKTVQLGKGTFRISTENGRAIAADVMQHWRTLGGGIPLNDKRRGRQQSFADETLLRVIAAGQILDEAKIAYKSPEFEDRLGRDHITQYDKWLYQALAEPLGFARDTSDVSALSYEDARLTAACQVISFGVRLLRDLATNDAIDIFALMNRNARIQVCAMLFNIGRVEERGLKTRQVKAAKGRHAETDEIKAELLRRWNNGEFATKAEAARWADKETALTDAHQAVPRWIRKHEKKQ